MIAVRTRLLAASASPSAVAAAAWTGGELGWWPAWLPGVAWAALGALASIPVALLAWALWPRSGPDAPPDPEAVQRSLRHAEQAAAAAAQVLQLARALVQDRTPAAPPPPPAPAGGESLSSNT